MAPGVLSNVEGAGNIPYQLAHIHDTRAPGTIAACAVLSALASIAIFLRILVRWSTKAGFKADDYTIFVTLIFAWGSFVSVYYETRNGLGYHLVSVKPWQLKSLTRALLFEAPTFQIAVMLNQLSLLLLYKRVFTTVVTWFRNVLYVLGVYCIASGLALFFAGLFHCYPLNYGWDKTVKGSCPVNIQALYITATVLNLVGDLGIVFAPIPIIWGLQMSKSTKAAVSFMFILGGFVSIINMIKLHSIVSIPLEDFTWVDVTVAIWTHAALCLGIVSACLPCYRPLVRGLIERYRTVRTSQSSTLRSSAQSKKSASDPYKQLDGKEPEMTSSKSMTGSKSALVTEDQWSHPSLPGLNNSTARSAEGGTHRDDIELGLVPKD